MIDYNLLRSKVWFPKLNLIVETEIQNCLACQVTVKQAIPPTPVHMTPMPKQPWDEIAVEFYGPILIRKSII